MIGGLWWVEILDISLKSGFVTELVPEGVFSTRVTFGTQQPIFVQIKQRSDGVTTASSHVNFCCFILEVGLQDSRGCIYSSSETSCSRFYRHHNASLVVFFICGATMWSWLRGCAWLIMGNLFKPLTGGRILSKIEAMMFHIFLCLYLWLCILSIHVCI